MRVRPGAKRNFARTIAAAAPIATPPDPQEMGYFWPFPRLPACGGNAARLRAARFPKVRAMAKSKSKSPSKSKAKSAAPAGGADVLARIADALERLAPQRAAAPDFDAADAFVWHPDGRRLAPVTRVNRVEMSLLKGIDRVRDVLVENTERFAKGLPANNALLWGARGMGKSSLVKAAHAGVNAALTRQGKSTPLKLIEIHREDIESLPDLMGSSAARPIASSCSATICRSTPRTPPTSRSRRCSKAASRAGRTT